MGSLARMVVHLVEPWKTAEHAKFVLLGKIGRSDLQQAFKLQASRAVLGVRSELVTSIRALDICVMYAICVS
jgi:hypothetical protein